jgi:hypothetical protein
MLKLKLIKGLSTEWVALFAFCILPESYFTAWLIINLNLIVNNSIPGV